VKLLLLLLLLPPLYCTCAFPPHRRMLLIITALTSSFLYQLTVYIKYSVLHAWSLARASRPSPSKLWDAALTSFRRMLRALQPIALVLETAS